MNATEDKSVPADCGARYLDPKYSRWISTDPALAEYIPGAGKSDEADKMPGMGGVFNSVNLSLFHYAGNNPVRYVDPDGREAAATFDYEYFYENLKLIEESIPELQVLMGGSAAVAASGVKSLGKALIKGGTAVIIFLFCLCLTGSTIETPAQEDANQKLSPEEAKALLTKMETEIKGIMSKPRNKKLTETYALVANSDGYYPNVRGGNVYLRKGEVWKYGQTSDSEHRYTPKYMTDYNLRMDDLFWGTKEECLIVEKIKIYGYYIDNGCLPPGNKIFR